MWDEGWRGFKNILGCLYTGSIHSSALYYPLASSPPARICFPCDCLELSDTLSCGSPHIGLPFSSEVRRPCTQLLGLALGTAVVASRNQRKSTAWGSTITASTALPRALNSHPCLKKKKNIAILLITAKWHTKRKLTIGCDLHSQSDSDFPASLSPFWCQADYSLPISFQPRQPKKKHCPHRATTSSLFWY